MNVRRLNTYIDDLIGGRRPQSFRADAEDTEIVRAAIALRAERPGDAAAEASFLASLHQELSDLKDQPQTATLQTSGWRRGRTALLGVAAALALIGGTVGITEASTQGTSQQSAAPIPRGHALRTATFETATGEVMGQIVVYHGRPSWVFMNVDVAQRIGAMRCELHLANGVVVAAGTVQLHAGRGQIAKAIQVDAGQLRTATLSDRSGAVIASATFV
jgi:hypothetical protein